MPAFDPQYAAKFLARVSAPDENGCRLWLGPVNISTGYTTFGPAWRVTYVGHRYAYELAKGAIPPGFHVDHLCRVRHCVNPDHLEAVTPQENALRRAAVITHCPQGHPYAGDNLHILPNGGRRCRACSRDVRRRYVARHRNDDRPLELNRWKGGNTWMGT